MHVSRKSQDSWDFCNHARRQHSQPQLRLNYGFSWFGSAAKHLFPDPVAPVSLQPHVDHSC